jgi:hypothetical protein
MQTYWFKNTLARPEKVQILSGVTSMTLIGESVARPLFRTSCIQRVPQIRFHIDVHIFNVLLLYLGSFICTNVQSKVVEATGISKSSLQ